ncbi:helix-turn-helix domain-containing protein [Vibrio parahaemolyticus]|uniref:helix-turn-helix domain-containing protein n=1 Tax=Vibrio parahaemolyticus TaxID=670 RepID=UPI003891B607
MSYKDIETHIDAILNSSIVGVDTVADDLFFALMVRIDMCATADEGKEIGNRIKEARLFLKNPPLNQRELAEKAGLDKSVISRMEAGNLKALNNIFKVAKALHIRVKWLLMEDGDPYAGALGKAIQDVSMALQDLRLMNELRQDEPTDDDVEEIEKATAALIGAIAKTEKKYPSHTFYSSARIRDEKSYAWKYKRKSDR